MENLNTQITELIAAVQRSDIPGVKRLLAAGISPTQYSADGQTALTVAAQTGNYQMVQLLCTAAVNHSNPGQVFLHSNTDKFIASSDATQAAAASPLTVPGFNSQQAYPVLFCDTCSPISSSLGLHTPTFASEDALKAPLNDSLHASSPIDRGATSTADQFAADQSTADQSALDLTPEALELAVRHNDIAAVKRLLLAGVCFRPVHWYDTPLLVIAAEKGYGEIAQALIDAGANVHVGCEQLPLHTAAANGHLDVVQRLLNSGAYIHAETDGGRTALMESAAAGHFLVTELLIANGANVNAVCRGETALALAAKGGHHSVYELLYPHVSPAGRVPLLGSTSDAMQLSLVEL